MNRNLEAICMGIIIGMCISITFYINKINKKVDSLTPITDTIVINDTITNLQYDTVYFNHYDTLKLPVVDTINDTVLKIDSILVQIPISTTVYDTTIVDSNYRTSLRAVVSGFDVSVNELIIETNVFQHQTISQKKWYNHIAPAIGIGYGVKGFGLFVGIGYTL